MCNSLGLEMEIIPPHVENNDYQNSNGNNKGNNILS
jgi:hypothetical protein